MNCKSAVESEVIDILLPCDVHVDIFCVHDLLHDPVSVATIGKSVSQDGHEFSCQHEKPLHMCVAFCCS